MRKLFAAMAAFMAAAALTTGCFFGSDDKPADNGTKAAAEVKQDTKNAAGNVKTEQKAKPEQNDKAAPQPAKADGKQQEEVKQVEKQEHNYSVLINKGQFTVYLLDNGKTVKSYGCALGKNPGQKEKSGDMKTPTGTFIIEEIIDSSAWTHDFGDGKGEIAGAYGPWFLSLDTTELSKGKWDGIGIHGTHDPASIGTRASEGCIRLLNENIADLKKHVKVGTRVTIVE